MLNGFSRLVFVSIFAALSAQAEEIEPLAETPILKFHAEREPLKVGETQTLFVQANVGFTKNEVVLEASLDGVRVEMNQTAPALWILSMASFTEVKKHLVEVKIFIRNLQEATRIREALVKLRAEIMDLNAKIDLEQDEAKKNNLIALRDSKQLMVDRLDDELLNLKVLFKAEAYAFDVLPDPLNGEFPQILSVTPNSGSETGGTVIQISGTNFPVDGMQSAALPIVKIGGINASVTSSSQTVITAVTPFFSSPGAKDVEVSFPSTTAPKNAIKENAFFAVSGNGISSNLKPVAVTNGYQAKSWPSPGLTNLVGSDSYDENGDTLSYRWVIKAVPKNSTLVPGAVLSTLPNPTFTPDRRGTFSFELFVRESSTSQSLESFPATATVEVN